MALTPLQVVILGAGGMGALFGAILQDGGLAVTLVDTNEAHREAVRRRGLRIRGFGGERTVHIPITGDAGEIERADLLLFQCKSYATRAAAEAARHLAESGADAVSFQNGLGNEEALAEVLGESRVLGGLTAMAGHLEAPGVVRDFSRVPSYLGELRGGLSPRAERIAAQLSAAGLETHASADIRTEIWKKLLGNIAMSAASGATDLTSIEVLRVPALRETCLRALDEGLAVATACGIVLERAAALRGLDTITEAGGTGDNKSSLCVDVLNRRPTEVEFIYGSVIRHARDHGVPTPTLDTLYALVKGLESHYL